MSSAPPKTNLRIVEKGIEYKRMDERHKSAQTEHNAGMELKFLNGRCQHVSRTTQTKLRIVQKGIEYN